jgi:hypothetical protein
MDAGKKIDEWPSSEIRKMDATWFHDSRLACFLDEASLAIVSIGVSCSASRDHSDLAPYREGIDIHVCSSNRNKRATMAIKATAMITAMVA